MPRWAESIVGEFRRSGEVLFLVSGQDWKKRSGTGVDMDWEGLGV